MNLYDPNEKEKFYTDISKLNEHDKMFRNEQKIWSKTVESRF
jgi:hypothetical protein